MTKKLCILTHSYAAQFRDGSRVFSAQPKPCLNEPPARHTSSNCSEFHMRRPWDSGVQSFAFGILSANEELMAKNIMLFVLILITVGISAAQTKVADEKLGNEPAVTVSNSGVPLLICSADHPEKNGDCVLSCKAPNRPAGSSCINPPRGTSMSKPKYPKQARKAKIQGAVVLLITIGPNGRVADPKVVRSVEHTLDQSAIDAVSQWRFDPATLEGKPVAARVDVEIAFRLR